MLGISLRNTVHAIKATLPSLTLDPPASGEGGLLCIALCSLLTGKSARNLRACALPLHMRRGWLACAVPLHSDVLVVASRSAVLYLVGWLEGPVG